MTILQFWCGVSLYLCARVEGSSAQGSPFSARRIVLCPVLVVLFLFCLGEAKGGFVFFVISCVVFCLCCERVLCVGRDTLLYDTVLQV